VGKCISRILQDQENTVSGASWWVAVAWTETSVPRRCHTGAPGVWPPIFQHTLPSYRSRGSSVSIVSDNGLDDRAIEVRSPEEAEGFSCSLCVQTSSGVHPASYPMGTWGPSLGVKCGQGVTVTTHPHLVPRSRMSRSYTSSPPKHLHGM
jgi:hypothetical protein